MKTIKISCPHCGRLVGIDLEWDGEYYQYDDSDCSACGEEIAEYYILPAIFTLEQNEREAAAEAKALEGID